jgi:hypothetical protein
LDISHNNLLMSYCPDQNNKKVPSIYIKMVLNPAVTQHLIVSDNSFCQSGLSLSCIIPVETV